MFAHRILVPIDFSPYSDAALALATSLARDGGGTLVLAHVEVIPLSAAGGEFLYAIPEPPTEELLDKLEHVTPPDSQIPRTPLFGSPNPRTSTSS